MNTTLSYVNDVIQFQHSTCPGKGPHDCRRTIYLERQFRNLLRVAHNLEKPMSRQQLPATDKRLDEIRSHQGSDRVCMQISIYMYLQEGWPNESGMDECVKPFYAVRSELSIQIGLLMRGCRLIIPADLQANVLRQLHSSHQGINKCRGRAKESVW